VVCCAVWRERREEVKGLVNHGKYKVKSAHQSVANQDGAYPGFCSMKRLGVFLDPAGWDVSHSLGYSMH